MSEFENSQIVSYIVFFCTLAVVLLTLTPVVFPALFSSFFGMFTDNLDPFELGYQSVFFIVSNILILGFGAAYYKKKIPSSVSDLIEKIRTFEISKKVSMISLAIILVVYVGLSTPELFLDESAQWSDYDAVLVPALEIWPFGESDDVYVQEQNDRYVRMFLLDASIDVFQNIKLLPFIASILIVVFTYLITVQFCQKRFAGIISVVVLLQSYTFLKFDTTAVYENFWVLFFLISLYVIEKKWFLSPIFYILAFYTKAYIAPFFLLTLFTTYRSQISRRTKITILISYVIIVSAAIAIIFLGDTVYPDVIEVNSSKFILGFQVIISQLRFDLFFIIALLPVTVGLLFLAKNKLKHADSILILIFGTIIASPILITFTYHYEILPYRFIPLLIFFSIGVGMFFSKKLVNNS
jgi:hypothetical protein|uniref:Glycosyltransferase RgtA/B/C/D-like domain-containing protein n=2 Tax=environmental samples TaxID=651140 RepID=A0A075G9E2_9ARCH|nr:hypothetical protein [uncultured marine thaumarchaeote KM3_06_A04]AIE98561.1 hypothetical protein [uncultured marine thaumarchaeote KM3_06_B06]